MLVHKVLQFTYVLRKVHNGLLSDCSHLRCLENYRKLASLDVQLVIYFE